MRARTIEVIADAMWRVELKIAMPALFRHSAARIFLIIRILESLRYGVARTFLSAGSGDFPVARLTHF